MRKPARGGVAPVDPSPGGLPGHDSTIAAARRGDETAWAAIYRQLAPAVLSYLRASRAAEPDDVLGEVMLQVVRDLGRFSGDERAFRAWALTIAHHRLLDERRRRGRRPADPTAPEALPERVADADAATAALARLGDARAAS